MPAKVTVRLTDDDYRAIKGHADSAGVSVSAYCTAAILRTAKLKTMRVEQPAMGLAGASEETRAAVASMGGQAGGRSRPKKN